MGKRSRSNSEVSESQQPARRSRRLASQEPEVLQQLPTTTRKRDIKRAKKPAPKSAPAPPAPAAAPSPPKIEHEPQTESSSEEEPPAAESQDTIPYSQDTTSYSQDTIPSSQDTVPYLQDSQVSESQDALAHSQNAQVLESAEAESEAESQQPAPELEPEPSTQTEVLAADIESTSRSRSPPAPFEPDLTVVEEEYEEVIETLPVPVTPTPLPAWRRYGGYLTSAVSRLSPFGRRASQPTLQSISRPNSRSATPPPPPPAESAQRPASQHSNLSAEPAPQPASQSPPSPAQKALRAILDRASSSPPPLQPIAASVETPMSSTGNLRKRAADEEEGVTTSKRAKVAEPEPTFKPTPRFSTQRHKAVKNPQRKDRSMSRDISAEPYSQPVPLPEKVEFIHLFKSPPPEKTQKRKAPSSEVKAARAPAETPTPKITVDHAPTNPPTPAPVKTPAPAKSFTSAKTSTPAQSVKSKAKGEEQSAAARTPAPAQSLKRKAPAEEPPTPTAVKTPFLMPSTKRPGTVTSLTPVTEATERSRLSLVSEETPVQPMYTPSHPPATAPARQPRSVTRARAARLAPQSAKRAGPYAWELAAAERERSRDAMSAFTSSVPPPPWNTPLPTAASSVRPAKPREANADARYAKLERLRKLEMELAQLREDEDIKEMEGHRMKRVKVDHLEWIPHKKPGDSEGTFRVPEWDSDDEMEVEESVPLRANIFDDVKDISTPVPAAQVSISPAPAPVSASPAPAPVSVPATPAPAAVTPPKRKYNFPDLGQRGESPSPGFKARCKAKFESGFAAWKERNGIVEV